MTRSFQRRSVQGQEEARLYAVRIFTDRGRRGRGHRTTRTTTRRRRRKRRRKRTTEKFRGADLPARRSAWRPSWCATFRRKRAAPRERSAPLSQRQQRPRSIPRRADRRVLSPACRRDIRVRFSVLVLPAGRRRGGESKVIKVTPHQSKQSKARGGGGRSSASSSSSSSSSSGSSGSDRNGGRRRRRRRLPVRRAARRAHRGADGERPRGAPEAAPPAGRRQSPRGPGLYALPQSHYRRCAAAAAASSSSSSSRASTPGSGKERGRDVAEPRAPATTTRR